MHAVFAATQIGLIKFGTKIIFGGPINEMGNFRRQHFGAGLNRRQCRRGRLTARRNGCIRIAASTFGQTTALSTHMDVGYTKTVVDLIGFATGIGMQNGLFKFLVGNVLENRQIVKQLTIFALRLHRIVCVLSHCHSP
jgi:hypothetical protein